MQTQSQNVGNGLSLECLYSNTTGIISGTAYYSRAPEITQFLMGLVLSNL